MKCESPRLVQIRTLRGLQVSAILSSIGLALVVMLLLASWRFPILRFLESASSFWEHLMIAGLLGVSLVVEFLCVVFTRELIRRLRRLLATAPHFLMDQDGQKRSALLADEIEQFEAYFNQMTEQLFKHMTQERVLVERNADLEEQVRLSLDLQDSVKQQLFEHIRQQRILVERNARLEERVYLARDLHDSVKQQLFALAVQVELARSLLDQDNAAAREHLCLADELSYQIQQELTALIRSLRPVDLQEKGLLRALREYTVSWGRQSKIVVTLLLPDDCLLPSSIEEALWRVTQEVLSNIARHSQATIVKLHLELTRQHVSLVIADDGQGFEHKEQEQEGLGLRFIRERIEQVGGTVQVESARGQGTCVMAMCPLLPVSNPAFNEKEETL